MSTRELICSEIWGGNGSIETDLVMPGLRGALRSYACGGGKGGDVYYSSACAAGVISRMCLADLAGHGEQVAQLGSWLLRTMRRNMGQHDPARVFHTMNQRATTFGIEALTTAVCFSYDVINMELHFCYAGHPPMYVLHRDADSWKPLAHETQSAGVSNVPLGVSESATFDTGILELREGDRLFLYSDGVLEAPHEEHGFFGENRLIATLNTARDKTTDELVRHVETVLRDHTRATEFAHDDVTFATLEVLPRESSSKVWLLLRNRSRRIARSMRGN